MNSSSARSMTTSPERQAITQDKTSDTTDVVEKSASPRRTTTVHVPSARTTADVRASRKLRRECADGGSSVTLIGSPLVDKRIRCCATRVQSNAPGLPTLPAESNTVWGLPPCHYLHYALSRVIARGLNRRFSPSTVEACGQEDVLAGGRVE